ncbi:MAG: LytTR family transcriptional regulator, partial [Pararhodobacter sp.]|nr:LytTR family transcriptional regulator [Pararhodobacter sp.]
MLRFLANPRFWAILGAVSLIVALSGPFHTLERLTFPTRLAYWGATAVLSGILMTFLSLFLRRLAAGRGWHWMSAALMAAAIGVLPVMALVVVANRLSTHNTGPIDFWGLLPPVAIPVFLITILVNWGLPDPQPL